MKKATFTAIVVASALTQGAYAWTCRVNGEKLQFKLGSGSIVDSFGNNKGGYYNLKPLKSWDMTFDGSTYSCMLKQDWSGDADCFAAGSPPLEVKACDFF
jgi:hypothetical protein